MDIFFRKGVLKMLLLFFSVLIAVLAVFFYFGLDGKTKKIANAYPENANSSMSLKKDTQILFLGDMMFDRYIRQVSDSRGSNFVFQGVSEMLKNNDLVVGNLEGPITDNLSASVNSQIGSSDNYIFTFQPQFAQVLRSENIGLVNIGNNHISNFGDAGIESTRKYLSNSGVGYFGDPQDEGKRMAIENINGFKIAFVNYDQFVADSENKTLSDIKNAKSQNVDFIFLYTHWGTEFVLQPSDKIINLAHEFIDAGADLIIGSHPHVIQTKEEYKGKTIYYSLGNFIFDQYFDPQTQKGLVVQVDIDAKDKSMRFKEIKIQMKNSGQTIIQQ
jgi:poly-gamma-glutamate synthesis protein (capsule biosynthesis protein)